MEKIFVQINDEKREATKEEAAEILAWRQAAEQAEKDALAAEEAKAIAKNALLEKLGITADEAKLLLENAETL